ncbi:hypothetical protein ACJJTC_003710 [Scirpophaga incertulas]
MADKLTLDRQAMKDRATSHLRIYVGGISDGTAVDELYDHFISYGQINGIVINRNFGFIQFETEQSAKDAISKADGSVFKGRNLSVRASVTNTDKPRRDLESMTIKSDIPPAVALSEITAAEEEGDEAYDSYGNYIGDQSGGFDRYKDYNRPVPVNERNDCEIIVVSKSLTEYAEYIESRLKRLGIVVDLLFPMEDVPIGKVLGNIASRGCLYAILVMPLNLENKSLTLTILHGLPQEHRNMPLEDALQLISRNFQEVQRGGSSGREAVYALLGQLADGRTLTVLQYDKVIEYLKERKEQQIKVELGEPLTKPASNKAEVDLQQRILSILNDKKVLAPSQPVKEPTPPPPPTNQSKLLNDPTVRKALDSILHKFT